MASGQGGASRAGQNHARAVKPPKILFFRASWEVPSFHTSRPIRCDGRSRTPPVAFFRWQNSGSCPDYPRKRPEKWSQFSIPNHAARMSAFAVAIGVIADIGRAAPMSAFDPFRHFAAAVCCDAQPLVRVTMWYAGHPRCGAVHEATRFHSANR
jgi:hypothetical protein